LIAKELQHGQRTLLELLHEDEDDVTDGPQIPMTSVYVQSQIVHVRGKREAHAVPLEPTAKVRPDGAQQIATSDAGARELALRVLEVDLAPLQLVELSVVASLRDQLFVGPGLHDPAGLQDENPIGHTDRGKPV
jgi:hypothetical protein